MATFDSRRIWLWLDGEVAQGATQMCVGCRSILGDLLRGFSHISVMNIRAEKAHAYPFAALLLDLVLS